MTRTRHQYRIYVKAAPERVWEGITDPSFTRRYFHGTEFISTLEVGSTARYAMSDGSDAVEGVIEVAEPPHRLVMTWRALYNPAMAEEPPGRVEWLLTPAGESMTRLDVIHGDLAFSPVTWASVKNGWVWILDSLKSLLETGEPLPAESSNAPAVDTDADGQWHRSQAVEANNSIWDLVEKPDRSPADDEELLRRAYAAAYHWERAAGAGPENEVRARYMLAKAHLLAGWPEHSLHYADACMEATVAAGLADFDLAYAYEARARALMALGHHDEAQVAWKEALGVPIADPDDKAIVDADLANGP